MKALVPTPDAGHGLERHLALASATAAPLWILLAWLVMGAMTLCGALCYGELAARFPQAGGGYVDLREAFGRRVAFFYGWKCLLVLDPGITAALGVAIVALGLPVYGVVFREPKR